MLNPVHLHTLVTVLRTGSFADAARSLNFTASAISQQMAALERASRLTLFEREAHSVTPTPAAMVLATHARAVLADMEDLENKVAEMVGGSAGLLRVGSFPTINSRLLPRWLSARRELYPELALQLDEGEPEMILTLLADGELDLGLVYRYDLVPRAYPRTLTAIPLLIDEVVVMVAEGNPLAKREVLDMATLSEEMWINTSDSADGTQCLQALAAQHGFIPKVDYRSNNYAVIRGLVSVDLGIALMPSLAVREGQGAVSRPLAAPIYRRIDIVHRRTMTNAAVPEAIRGLLVAAGELAEDIPGISLPEG
ncbi:LysR family transcriptional regulator [Propioniferax innocua]|uniref:DNA-binding transcriptional LysR family regulator n=1 Tax=Propioniferax innocua TaxID=1753 RepID=A0A542ZQ83_9ACTN|nr:LysR family transcriptional regulator [Propioniferax innocua]TQL62523.1 DNA-binding transcriptional LysR family regulator [Propioniferax innocua]